MDYKRQDIYFVALFIFTHAGVWIRCFQIHYILGCMFSEMLLLNVRHYGFSVFLLCQSAPRKMNAAPGLVACQMPANSMSSIVVPKIYNDDDFLLKS